MGHAIGSILGLNDWHSFDPSNSDKNLQTITNDDYAAMHFENQIRAFYNIPLREFYTKDESGKGFMRAVVPFTSIGVNLFNYKTNTFLYGN